MAQTGRCLCGNVTYEIDGDVLADVICHCDHCQRQSGGAFSTNVVVRPDQLTVHGELKIYEDRGRTGDAVYVLRKFCGDCGSPIVSELTGPGILAVKAGTLDDRSGVKPTMQVWCEEQQPWVELPEMITKPQE